METTKGDSRWSRAFWALVMLSVAIFMFTFFAFNFGFLAAVGAVVFFWLSAISLMALVDLWKAKKDKIFSSSQSNQPDPPEKAHITMSFKNIAKMIFAYITGFKNEALKLPPPVQPEVPLKEIAYPENKQESTSGLEEPDKSGRRKSSMQTAPVNGTPPNIITTVTDAKPTNTSMRNTTNIY